MSEVVIVLEGERVPSWNGMYAGAHHAKRAKMAREIHWKVRAALPEDTIPFDAAVDIFITAMMKHPVMDSDNVVAKVYIDGLKPHVIHDDDGKWVRRVTTEAVKGKENKVTIRITEVTG
jgi:Holliday junction resolvase RusA-like endonuclease